MQYQIIVYHFVIDTVCLFKPVLHIEMNRRFIYIHDKQPYVFRPSSPARAIAPLSAILPIPFLR